MYNNNLERAGLPSNMVRFNRTEGAGKIPPEDLTISRAVTGRGSLNSTVEKLVEENLIMLSRADNYKITTRPTVQSEKTTDVATSESEEFRVLNIDKSKYADLTLSVTNCKSNLIQLSVDLPPDLVDEPGRAITKELLSQVNELLNEKEVTRNPQISEKNLPIMSDREICELIAAIMTKVHDEYLEIYTNAVEKQTAYWKQYTEFQSNLTKQTNSESSDKIKITGIDNLQNDLDNLIAFTGKDPDPGQINEAFVLYPVNGGTVDKATAERWAKELGLPATCVAGNDSQGYVVVIDTTPVQTLRESKVFSMKEGEIWTGTTVEYQAWITDYNAQSENIKTNTQTLTTKYSASYSQYDTIVKLLSSSISALFDCVKEALRF